MTEADFQKRLADAFFGSLHKMNAVHITADQVDTLDQEKLALIRRLSDAFFGGMHKLNADHTSKMQTPPNAVSSEARQLLCELRDITQSRSTYDRCVAIVGERAP